MKPIAVKCSDVEQKVKAQLEFVRRTGLTLFAPHNGICWKCGKQIYEEIPLDTAANHLITGCPFCSRSYVD